MVFGSYWAQLIYFYFALFFLSIIYFFQGYEVNSKVALDADQFCKEVSKILIQMPIGEWWCCSWVFFGSMYTQETQIQVHVYHQFLFFKPVSVMCMANHWALYCIVCLYNPWCFVYGITKKYNIPYYSIWYNQWFPTTKGNVISMGITIHRYMWDRVFR